MIRLALLLALLVGCGPRDNPYGPKRAPTLHYADCANRCTALGAQGTHQRRP